MFFWRKKSLNSEEYLEIKKELAMIWLEIDILTQRYKRRVTKKETPEETQTSKYNDGFDELRTLNKENALS